MGGAYRRGYLDSKAEAAFQRMKTATGVGENRYVTEAIKEKLIRDGHLKEGSGLDLSHRESISYDVGNTAQGAEEEQQHDRTQRVRRRRRSRPAGAA